MTFLDQRKPTEAVWKRMATHSTEHLGTNQAEVADGMPSLLRLIGLRPIL